MKARWMFWVPAVGMALAGCDFSLQSARTLRLPQGDAARGKVAFTALKCVECHTVTGVELPAPTAKPENVVALGGEVPRLRTVGDLLTSIIHPNYALSDQWKRPAGQPVPKSPMRTVNDEMTVAQMIDLVTFLQPRYTRMVPPADWSYSM